MQSTITWVDVAGIGIEILIAVLIVYLLVAMRRTIRVIEELLVHVDEGVYGEKDHENPCK